MDNDIELAQVTLDQDYEKDQKKFSFEEVTSNVFPKGRYKAKRLYKVLTSHSMQFPSSDPELAKLSMGQITTQAQVISNLCVN